MIVTIWITPPQLDPEELNPGIRREIFKEPFEGEPAVFACEIMDRIERAQPGCKAECGPVSLEGWGR